MSGHVEAAEADLLLEAGVDQAGLEAEHGAEVGEDWDEQEWLVKWRRDRLLRNEDGSWGHKRDGRVRRVIYPAE